MTLYFLALIFADEKPSVSQNIPKELINDVQLLKNDLAQNLYDDALIKIEALINVSQKLDQRTLIWLYEKKAQVHTDKYHFHFAIDSLERVQAINKGNNKYKQQIADLKKIIEKNQSERHLRQSYRDARNSGIAKSLKNKVTIAYFYLDDNRWSSWSNKALSLIHI